MRGKRRSRTLERYLAIPVFGTGCSPHCGAFLGGRAGTRTLNGPAGRYSLSGRAPRLAGPLPWSPRLESNQWPPRSERGALSAELQGEGGRRGNTRLVLGHSTSRRPQSPHHESNVAAGLRGANGRSAAEELAPLAGADPATSALTTRRSSVELQRLACPASESNGDPRGKGPVGCVTSAGRSPWSWSRTSRA